MNRNNPIFIQWLDILLVDVVLTTSHILSIMKKQMDLRISELFLGHYYVCHICRNESIPIC